MQLVDAESISVSIGRHIHENRHEGNGFDGRGNVETSPLIGWLPPTLFLWKVNADVAWSPVSKTGGLGWVLRDHLDHVHHVGLQFTPRCYEVKVLEVMIICPKLKVFPQSKYFEYYPS